MLNVIQWIKEGVKLPKQQFSKQPLSKKNWLLIFIGCVAIFITLLTVAVFQQAQGFGTSSAVKQFPPFQSTLLITKKVVSEQDFFQRPYQLVNVWASWCGVCRLEHPLLMDLAKKGVVIQGLNYRDKHDAAVTYLEGAGNPYQHVLYDPKGKVAIDLGVVGTPETYLVDQQGVIVLKHQGVLNHSVWADKFAPYFSDIEVVQ